MLGKHWSFTKRRRSVAGMLAFMSALFSWLACRFRSRADLELEVIALRHQLAVLSRQHPGRTHLFPIDRLLWVWLYRVWPRCLDVMVLVKPATVAKYMVRRPGTPSQTWRSFLRNHADGIAAIDMFVVASTSFRLLYVMIILAHDRRKVMRFDVTQNPTAVWLSHQVTEAFPWDTAPRFLLRDRDASYGAPFRKRVEVMGITEVITAPRSTWQNAYVERVIGSIRRECLDHIVIFNERHLRRVLSSYVDYYHRTRTHLSLDKDCPHSRPIQPPRIGRVIAIPQVRGLHHRYQRLAA
jgi:putative transposase